MVHRGTSIDPNKPAGIAKPAEGRHRCINELVTCPLRTCNGWRVPWREAGTPARGPSLDPQTPPYFNQEGADAFRAMETEEDDVIMVSYGKSCLPMATGWWVSV